MRANFRLLKTGISSTNRSVLTVALSCLTVLLLFMMPLSSLNVTKAQKTADTSSVDVPTAIIYDNGPLATGTVARNGTTAPAGTQWSEASYNFGETAVANTLAGVGCQIIGAATSNRCADDFNVPIGQTWTINQVLVFSYQANAVVSPIVGARLQIWNGRPGDAGSVIVFGDLTTNRLGSSSDSGLFRIFNSGPPNNTATGTTRRIWQVNINVAPALVLGAGNYWVDFQVDAGAGGNFSPPATITGVRGVPGWNARQFIGPPTNTGWADSFDDGTPVTGANIKQEFPFKLDGTVEGAAAIPPSRTVDFNGDNRSDLAVARAATVGAQTTWFIQNSGGAITTAQWGLGVGFTGGDVAVPEDFDGDGKADIAVWRSDPTAANFYILLSSNGTLRTEQFGKAGDDPTVSRDYDGDGKSDVAVFRSNSGGGDPCGGASVWYWRPSGTPATNFAYACWGVAGDKPYPGDFDGDRKADFSVIRNNGGAGLILQDLTTAPDRTVSHGNFSDRYVCGDFDADGRADLAAIRVNGATLTWYLIKSGGNQSFAFDLGVSATDYIVPGDYDGDNKTDFALWSSGAGANSGNFYIVKTFTSPVNVKFGQSSATDALPKPDYPVGTYRVYVPEQVSR